ncbi:MAG: helix-turn-helix domain-containing protein [Dehalococcoidia bacterium]|nr:helix-turn-helix domain-containing protein [Dehalococcoidia bacterium]
MTDHDLGPFCPHYHRAVELIGGRWTGAVLRALLSGVQRFTDLTETIPGLSDRMLSQRLKELEAEGIVVRTVIPETPVRVEYSLTEKGRALQAAIEAVSGWADQWLASRAREAEDSAAKTPTPGASP